MIGRPPVLIALHRKAGVVAGIDFGKRHVRLALSDLSHALLAERHLPLDADLPAKEAIALAARLFADALEEAEVSRDEVVGVGMGLPGPVHRPSGELGNSTILPGWAGTRASHAVEQALGFPVEVENDANLGALGEWMWGAGRGADHMAYVKASTGIGAGFIVAGEPYVGAGGTAGELGHTVVDPGGPICRCGNRGCLETYAGAPAILVLAARHPRRGADAGRGGGASRCAATPAARARSPTRARRSARPWPRCATSSTRIASWSAATSARRASCCSSRCGNRWSAGRSARRRRTSRSSRASWASAPKCWELLRLC